MAINKRTIQLGEREIFVIPLVYVGGFTPRLVNVVHSKEH